MKANWRHSVVQQNLPRVTMANFKRRAAIDEHLHDVVKQHEDRRWQELNAYAASAEATLLWTLHQELGFGKKRLRRIWEATIRNRIAYRQFFRDGDDYQERKTGKNIEDTAIRADLRRIGVDIDAWGSEEIHVDDKNGEVSFGVHDV